MRIMITGHMGYIGTVMTPMVQKAGHTVIGYDSDLFRRCTYATGEEINAVPHIRKDVRDAQVSDFDGLDAILHLAALSTSSGDLAPRRPIASTTTQRAHCHWPGGWRQRFGFASSRRTTVAGVRIVTDGAAQPRHPYGDRRCARARHAARLAGDGSAQLASGDRSWRVAAAQVRHRSTISVHAVTTGHLPEVRLFSCGGHRASKTSAGPSLPRSRRRRSAYSTRRSTWPDGTQLPIRDLAEIVASSF